MNTKTPSLIIIALLLLALLPMPYGFYTLVRICVCLFSIFLAYKTWQEKIELWMWIFIVIAILFNPIIPIFLGRGLWAFLDIITAVVFFASISQLKLK
ncbi:DUF6804 family protein [Candidatus Neomarinimicrobiota bacterium]